MASENVRINGKAYTSSQHATRVVLPDGSDMSLPGLQTLDYEDSYERAVIVGDNEGKSLGKAQSGKYSVGAASWKMLVDTFYTLQRALDSYGATLTPQLASGQVDFTVIVSKVDGSNIVIDRLENCHLAKRKTGYDNSASDPAMYEGDLSPERIWLDGINPAQRA